MEAMFNRCYNFNQPIGGWNVEKLENMMQMFRYCSIFNQDIGNWNTSNVTDMNAMFKYCIKFNQNLLNNGNKWNVFNVTNMKEMFFDCEIFNGDINNWVTRNVNTFNSMFFDAYEFNQPIGNWDTSNVTSMEAMFFSSETTNSKFNQPIGNWDTSNVTDMRDMFARSLFNQPIDEWNVSSVTNMRSMFYDAGYFTQDIRKWNLKSGVDLTMFCGSANNFIERWKLYPGLPDNAQGNDGTIQPTPDFFYSPDQRIHTFADQTDFDTALTLYKTNYPDSTSNDSTPKYADLYGYINTWNTQNVTNMDYAFNASGAYSSLQNWNEDITNWNVSNVTSMEAMFNNCYIFNQPIGNWNVSNVTTMEFMFSRCYIFNQPIGDWDTSKVTYMPSMFSTSRAFNQNLLTDGNKWNVSNVKTMENMFIACDKFNGDISNWDTSNVTTFDSMFKHAFEFNKPIGSWNTNSCKVMTEMFYRAYDFNQPIGNWNVSKVENMSYMFYGYESTYHKFNQPIGNWDTENVTHMTGMFYKCLFNQPIGDWNVSNVAIMTSMFNDAGHFAQDIRKWTLKSSVVLTDFCSSANAFIERWRAYPGLNSNLQGGDAGQPTRDFFYSPEQRIHTFVNDAEFINAVKQFRQDFVHGQPNNSISTDSTPKYADLYGYIQNWDTQNVTNMDNVFNNNQANVSGEVTPFGDNGNHGPVLSVNFNEDISNWNTSNVTSMYRMFKWTMFNRNLLTNGNKWNVSKVENMHEMFTNSYHFNGDISNWNTSNVTNMFGMFWISQKFNQNISSWDTSNVTNMVNLFANSVEYNQPLTGWDTSRVQDMSYMFSNASKFNENITGSSWNVSNVTDMEWMFSGTKFNRDISNWNVSNVTSTLGMFFNVSDFNQNISTWDTGKVKDMYVMLEGASSFNQAIGGWNVSSVTRMNGLFKKASNFNQSLSSWDTSNVTGMNNMFYQASVFAYDIRSWNTSNIVTGGFNNMLYQATNFSNIFIGYPGFGAIPSSSFFDSNWFPDPVSSISNLTSTTFTEGNYQWTRIIAEAGETSDIYLISNYDNYPGNEFYLYYLVVGGGGGGGCGMSNLWKDDYPNSSSYNDIIAARNITRPPTNDYNEPNYNYNTSSPYTGGGGNGGVVQNNFDSAWNIREINFGGVTSLEKIKIDYVGIGGNKPVVKRQGEGIGADGAYWYNTSDSLNSKNYERIIQGTSYNGEDSSITITAKNDFSYQVSANGGSCGATVKFGNNITWNKLYSSNNGWGFTNNTRVYWTKSFYETASSNAGSGGAPYKLTSVNDSDNASNNAVYSGDASTKLNGTNSTIPINDNLANIYYGGGGPAGKADGNSGSTAKHYWANNNTGIKSESTPNSNDNWGIGGRGMKQHVTQDEYLDSEAHHGTAGYDGRVIIWIGVKKPL